MQHNIYQYLDTHPTLYNETRTQVSVEVGLWPEDYKTIRTLTYPETLSLLEESDTEIEVSGYYVKVQNPRYILFRANRYCVWCGIPTTLVYLRTQKHIKPGGYAVFTFHDIEDKLLFTKDHIMPRKRGGQDVQWNYQTMCNRCNSMKGHGHPHSDRFLHPHTRYTDHEKEVELLMRERFGH